MFKVAEKWVNQESLSNLTNQLTKKIKRLTNNLKNQFITLNILYYLVLNNNI